MYKYQRETFNYLEEIKERLEKLTDSRMSLPIGFIRGEYLSPSGTKYYKENRDLFFCLNHDDGVFKTVGDIDSDYGVCDEDVVRLKKTLFIDLNDFIDKIYKNKHDREEFHDKLNKELKALNNSL